MKLRILQIAVIVLAVLGIASVVVIGLAINDIYGKLNNVTVRLCLVENWQQDSLRIIALHTHVKLPTPPANLPSLPKPCTAKPDGFR